MSVSASRDLCLTACAFSLHVFAPYLGQFPIFPFLLVCIIYHLLGASASFPSAAAGVCARALLCRLNADSEREKCLVLFTCDHLWQSHTLYSARQSEFRPPTGGSERVKTSMGNGEEMGGVDSDEASRLLPKSQWCSPVWGHVVLVACSVPLGSWIRYWPCMSLGKTSGPLHLKLTLGGGWNGCKFLIWHSWKQSKSQEVFMCQSELLEIIPQVQSQIFQNACHSGINLKYSFRTLSPVN